MTELFFFNYKPRDFSGLSRNVVVNTFLSQARTPAERRLVRRAASAVRRNSLLWQEKAVQYNRPWGSYPHEEEYARALDAHISCIWEEFCRGAEL